MNGTNKQQVRALCLISTEKLAKQTVEIFDEEKIALTCGLIAEGTASSDILDMLGLGSTEKRFLFSCVSKDTADRVMARLMRELNLGTVNSGIAFTVALTGASKLVIRLSGSSEVCEGTAEEKDIHIEKGDETIMAEKKYSLIAALINRGFSGEVMTTAREAGAGGGTVIHSRHLINEDMANLWGIGLQEEKEILLIISDAEKKTEIMSAISASHGVKSEAEGLVMSLPIESVLGI